MMLVKNYTARFYQLNEQVAFLFYDLPGIIQTSPSWNFVPLQITAGRVIDPFKG